MTELGKAIVEEVLRARNHGYAPIEDEYTARDRREIVRDLRAAAYAIIDHILGDDA